MPYTDSSYFGITHGNLTDAERLRAQMGQSQAAINAQMQALQAEIADRQAGRQFEGGQNAAERTFRAGTQDKDLANRTALSLEDTKRALGVVGAQMQPAMMGAQLDRDKFNVDAPRRAIQADMLQQFRQSLAGGAGGGTAATGAPGTPQAISQVPPGGVPMPGAGASRFQMDPDMMAAMAFGGNPADILAQRRQSANSDRAHDDAEDASTVQIINAAIASGKPEALALAEHLSANLHNKSLQGANFAALRPAMAPADAITKSPELAQAFDQLAAMATDTSKSVNTGANLDTIKTRVAQMAKALTDKGVSPGDAMAYIKSELDKRVPKETGLRLGAFFPGISSVGQTRQAIGLDN